MSDRELLDALSVIARRMGLIDETWRLAIENVPDAPRDDALCLAHGRYREVRLLCTYAKGHDRACSWVGAMIGKSPCMATSHFATTPGVTVHECQLPTHHAGEHGATGADGVRWTWGDAPTTGLVYAANKAREAAAKGCEAWEWGTNGHKAGCMLSAGHEGPHKGLDADGTSVFTWPCPCYPDCSGHVVTPKSCRSHSPRADNGAYYTCVLLKGHEGEHRSITALGPKMWGDVAPDPSAPRT